MSDVPPPSGPPSPDTAPSETSQMADGPRAIFAQWLRELTVREGSDLHIKVGSPPLLRTGVALERLDLPPVSPDLADALADSLIPENRKNRFERDCAVDFAHSERSIGRFR